MVMIVDLFYDVAFVSLMLWGPLLSLLVGLRGCGCLCVVLVVWVV